MSDDFLIASYVMSATASISETALHGILENRAELAQEHHSQQVARPSWLINPKRQAINM